MYKNCKDPWNISKMIKKNIDYDLIIAIIKHYSKRNNISMPQILEIGSGKGYFSKKLSDVGKVTGIEISKTAMEFARQYAKDAEFICSDIREIKLKAKFDFIIFFRCIWYIIDDIEKCLINIRKCMKKSTIGIFEINFYKEEYYGKKIISSKQDFLNILRKNFNIIESIDYYSDTDNFLNYSIIICSKN